MTNQEEAIMRLQRFKETSDGTYEWSTFVNKDDLKAFDMAIKALEQEQNVEELQKRSYLEGFHEALKMLVNQEPSGDLISREAVLDYIYNDLGLGDEENGKDVERQMELENSYRYVKSLPSVNPQEIEPKYCDRNICIKNEYNGIGCDECEVTKSQEPKTGHWTRISIDKYVQHAQYYYKCSECGGDIIGEHNYCPNCRAKMIKSQESEG